MKRIIKHAAQGIALVITLIILFLLLWPVIIDPAAWTFPEAPTLTGVFEENDHLSRVEKLATGYYGPEAIAIGNDGYLYTGLLFANDLVIASDRKIYFSDASVKYSHTEFLADLLEHRPNGRILVFNPQSGETSVLLDELYFPNGVAFSPDERFLLFCETKHKLLLLKGQSQKK